MTMESDTPFMFVAPERLLSPVVISVPHAGRYYSSALHDLSRGPIGRLIALEDRFADMLVDDAVAHDGVAAVVACRARAWIDLNRDPRELDPGMISPSPDSHGLIHGAKVRAGLGLLPRLLPGVGELWSRRLTSAELEERLSATHEPYHRAVGVQLARAKAEFGQAVLIDCHSMPPLPSERGRRKVDIVIGDRFGRSAADPYVDAAMMTIATHGLHAARNLPYAGGYTLDRHGSPRRDIHALQIELDRSLYLDENLKEAGVGLGRCRRLLADIANRLGTMAGGRTGLSLAAE
jgi:N-formylglutamate amidohydrolase